MSWTPGSVGLPYHLPVAGIDLPIEAWPGNDTIVNVRGAAVNRFVGDTVTEDKGERIE